MHPYLFLFGHRIPTWSATLVASFVAGSLVSYRSLRALQRRGVRISTTHEPGSVELAIEIWGITLAALVVGLGGARLAHVAEDSPFTWLSQLRESGVSGPRNVLGGLILASGAIWWRVRSLHWRASVVADGAIGGVLVAYGIGRLGCHLAGDGCWGQPATRQGWLFACDYVHAVAGAPGHPVLPTSLWEAAIAGSAGVGLALLGRRAGTPGAVWWLGVGVLGVERFFIEFVRVNHRFGVGALALTQAQFVSLFLTALAAAMLLRLAPRRRNSTESIPLRGPATGGPRPGGA